MEKGGFVYIMASGRNGTLYTGVTSELPIRVAQHKDGTFGGFTHKYGCKRLVWFEQHGDIETAIVREKRIKGWNRLWKLRLIEEMNPDWDDLYEGLFYLSSSPRRRPGPRPGKRSRRKAASFVWDWVPAFAGMTE